MAMKILPYSKVPENPYREQPVMVHDLMGVRAWNDFKSRSNSPWIRNIPYVDHRYPNVSSLKQQLPHFSEKHAFSPNGAYLVFESPESSLQSVLVVYCTQSWQVKQTISIGSNQELDSGISFFFAPDSAHLLVVTKQLLSVYSVNQATPLSQNNLLLFSRKSGSQEFPRAAAAPSSRLNAQNWSLCGLRVYGFFDSKDFLTSPELELSRTSMTEYCIIGDADSLLLLNLRDWNPSHSLKGRMHDVTPSGWGQLVEGAKEIFHRAPLKFWTLISENSQTRLLEYSVGLSSFESLIQKFASTGTQQSPETLPIQGFPLVLTQTQELKLGETDGIVDSAFGTSTLRQIWWADPHQFTLSCLKADSAGIFEAANPEPLVLDYSAGTPVSLTSVLGGKFAIMYCKSPDMGRIFGPHHREFKNDESYRSVKLKAEDFQLVRIT